MITIITCVSTVLCLIIWFLLKWRKVKKFWADRGVPHYSPHPIFGSLAFLQRKNPAVWMKQVYNEFKTPYVGMWAFWRPGLVINCPDLARKVLVKDHEVFKNRFLSSGKSDPIGGLNLFTVNDPTWSFLRRRLTILFTAARLRSLNSLLSAKSNDMVKRIRDDMSNEDPLNLRVLCSDFTTDVIGEAAFGLTSESVRTGHSLMRRITKEFVKFNLHRGLCWSSIFFFPEIVDVFRFSLFPKDSLEVLRHIFRTIINQRGGYEKEVKQCRDLLDALLKIRQEAAEDNEEISEDLLLAQAAIFLLGGFDTSGVTLTWTLYELAWNPLCQERLYQELLDAKQKNGDKDLDASSLAELTYINCVIKEALRKFPSMGWLDRIASQDYKIDENLTIPKGTVVYVNAVGMQQDPQYFPNPQIYNADRFLPENERNITPYTFLPFGDGPRGCIGKRFGYQTVRCGLAAIILNYEIRALPNMPKPNECHIEKNGLFLGPDKKLSIEFRLRN
ncbi:cytochrome P450 6k1-like [Spodoptera litura]|uniref:unspecific monooxygenase n=1 Tax=Spodoptera litura TaxID=69820 RepID=A0A9J7E6A2_SPOLT|nr:cytochrome P450 6k1-like [Spodoptera litura]